MRVVLDTNVVVAALLSPDGAPARVLALVISGEAVLCWDERILREYRAVLARPRFAFDAADVRRLLAFLESAGEPVTAPPLTVGLPDPEDAKFLEVAAAGRADALITGNLRHFPESQRGGVRVASPSELLAEGGTERSGVAP